MTPYYDEDGVTIYHGDSRDVLPTLGGGFDALITDPPYSVSVTNSFNAGPRGTRRLDFFDGDNDWQGMTTTVVDVVGASLDSITPTASVYVWLGHRQIGAVVHLVEARGLSTRMLVWAKKVPPPPAPGAGWPSGAELCVYGYPPGRTWNDKVSRRYRSNVIVADSFRHGQPGKVDHPTQKPVQVIVPLLACSTVAGHRVIDPFMGSGTTLVAARSMGRRAVGIEIEERYCEVAAKRLSQMVLGLPEVAT